MIAFIVFVATTPAAAPETCSIAPPIARKIIRPRRLMAEDTYVMSGELVTLAQGRVTVSELRIGDEPAKEPLFKHAEQHAAAPATTNNSTRLGTGLILFALMALGSVAAVQMKKRGKKNADQASQIEVLASHAFSPKQRMQVVQIGGERMLVAVTDKGIQLLCGLKPDQPMPSFEQTLETHIELPSFDAQPAEQASAVSPEIAGILRMKKARDAARGLS